ncbi:MAG: SDR family oxidoreductase [Planctomycetaceae bacterium]|nr:MAG: SDR family oxidoreductase [Planctomycetaceae bacterium]
MDLGLRDKVALVTGGYRGLGRSICRMLADEGACVAVNHRHSPDQANELVQQIRRQCGTAAIAVAGDVANEADVARMFDQIEQELGPVDALINNAAYCPPAATVDLTLEEFERAMHVNLAGTFLCSRELARRSLPASRTGKIVNISSQAAFRGSESGKTAYDASKTGIIGFTISLAREMAPHGILVNCVAPGLMYTEMLAPAVDADPERFNRRVPLGRLGKTEEIAAMVVFLCSRHADYMTGATVDVSGGLAMH